MNMQFDVNLLAKTIQQDRLQAAEQERFYAKFRKNKTVGLFGWIKSIPHTLRYRYQRAGVRLAIRTPIQYLDVNSTIECTSC